MKREAFAMHVTCMCMYNACANDASSIVIILCKLDWVSYEMWIVWVHVPNPRPFQGLAGLSWILKSQTDIQCESGLKEHSFFTEIRCLDWPVNHTTEALQREIQHVVQINKASTSSAHPQLWSDPPDLAVTSHCGQNAWNHINTSMITASLTNSPL